MGTGIVFVYLMIAALVAPFVWLIWWGAGSLAGGRARPAVAAASPTTRTSRVTSFPRPVDVALPGRAYAVTVYSAEGRELSTCLGPDADGKCPRPLEDGSVPCAGCVLALPRPIRGSFEWQIPSGYRACLLGSYDVFRQAQIARG